MNMPRGKLLVKMGLEKFQQTLNAGPQEQEKCDDCTLQNMSSATLLDVDVDEPYQSSGSEYIPDSENTDSAEETMDQEIDLNVKESEGRKKRGRKRNIINQSRQDRKKFANFNLKYVSAKNKIVPPKIFKEEYSCPCSKNCHTAVNVEIRRRFFLQYWNIGTFEGRCALLSKCVQEVDKKRCYTKTKISRRSKSRKYYIDNTSVCKDTFLSTLQVNHNRIRVALDQMKNNIILDKRGRSSGGRNAIDEERIKKIKEHIASFPTYVSHYCRSQTDSNFLHPELNLAKMYQFYKEITEQPVSLTKYKSVFYSNFNLRFKTPHKDTCRSCDKYKVQVTSAQDLKKKEDLDRDHKKHLEIAEDLRSQMKADLICAQEDETLETLTFDLQKTHPLPKIPTGVAYYKRQLNLFNLGIYVGSTKKGVFNVWTEREAGRGTQEVGSCLRKYINENIKAPVKKLILWSDSCGGQNRSIKLVLMLIHVLQNHNSLESISLKFLLSGHSFLPNDSHFGDVECALKTHERLYTDHDYMQIMYSCRRKNKFIVNRIRSDEMVSVNLLEKSITNRKVDTNKENINWLKTHVIKITKENPAVLFMKNHVSDERFLEVNIEKTGKGRKPVLKYIDLPPLWPNGKPLSAEKIKDLKYLYSLIPQDAKPFYDFLDIVECVDFQEDLEGIGLDPDFQIDPDQMEELIK